MYIYDHRTTYSAPALLARRAADRAGRGAAAATAAAAACLPSGCRLFASSFPRKPPTGPI